MPRLRPLQITVAVLRVLAYTLAALLVFGGLALAVVETDWGKNQIRRIIISQANNYLAATLDIGRLDGSLLRGLTLGDVRLSRDGDTIISVDEVSLSYSIRELLEPGLTIARIQLTKPRVVVAKLADGRWNLSALLKRERRDQRSGPGRPVHVLAAEISEGDVAFLDDFALGDVHIPGRYASLNASLSFDYEPVMWRVKLGNISWAGGGQSLGMTDLHGGIADGPSGWAFDSLSVQTVRSAFVVSGRVNRATPSQPAALDLHVDAQRFAFQEWGGVLHGLGDIAVDSAFGLELKGPLTGLATVINLTSKSGDVRASLTLDTTVPGWHASGRATVAAVDLSHWLNRDDRPSNITGQASFNLDLDLGRHFPRGSYRFEGPHAAYIGYEIDDVRAAGTLTRTDALVAEATGTAYGAPLHITSGSVGLDAPHAFRFNGSCGGLDLMKLPEQVPITHVDSQLALDAFDVAGQFDAPAFIRGGAQLGGSQYLGATIAAGAAGTIDTSVDPARYTGEGDIAGLDMARFGEELDVDWMREPRWAGTLAGHFRVDGAGTESASMRIDAAGHLARADMFGGRFDDADVNVHIADGSLSGAYDGRLSSVDTAKALADEQFAATVTGAAKATFSVRDLLLRTTTTSDYHVEGTLDAEKSVVRGLAIDRGSIAAKLDGTTLEVGRLQTQGPLDMTGSGTLEFDGQRDSNFTYQVGSADLSLASELSGRQLDGTITTNGTLTGPTSAMRLAGEASLDNVDVDGTSVLSATAQYELTIPWDTPSRSSGRITGSATEIYALDREIPSVVGTIAYDNERLDADLKIQGDADPTSALASIAIAGSGYLHAQERTLDLSKLVVALQSTTWQLTSGASTPRLAWSDAGFEVSALNLSDTGRGSQHASISGTWRNDGSGALRLSARQVSLDPWTSAPGGPAQYGGVLDADATLRGTRERPTATADFSITDGRVRKLAYQKLGGRVSYDAGRLDVDVRLDQGPGVWLTAKGVVPAGLALGAGEGPINLALLSSPIGLGLIEGVTDAVRDVSGRMTLNVNVTGTTREPRFSGTVSLEDAAFLVVSSGGRYKNGRAAFELASDRVNVSSFHLEDRNGRPLDVSGSLSTRALSVGDIHIDATARRFEVLRNAAGTVDVNATLTLSGSPEAPRLSGNVSILNGELKADEIFERALFQPYATQAAASASSLTPEGKAMDAIAALDLWDRLGLDVAVHSPGTLRMIGDNVQVATGTPLGIGSFNLRATGDLYLDKEPAQPLYVTGSLDSLSGSYAFQGRRFDVDPTSSINFRGDISPDVYVTVNRLISGIQTHVTISGNLRQPELQLTSNPPLEQSDILSLIVFNTSTGELSAAQQQELAVRAGTLAYGFVATPLVSALQRSIGIETLEISPPSGATGTTITVGNELAPGLVAQFTREFGQEAYDEARVEYNISRILRLRATFSDAQSLIARSPFRRIERAGIDLLFFFSF